MKCELSCCLDVKDPSLEHIPLVLSQLIGFLRDHGVVDEIFLSEFELIAAEAINNATEHGCVGVEEKFFRARLYLKPDHVELRVVDPSNFSGIDSDPALPADPFAEGGRGYFIMSRMADEVLHEQENGCHVLVLRKRFDTSGWFYQPGQSDQIVTDIADELVSSYELINTMVSLGEWLAMAPDMHAFMDGALERLCAVTGAECAYIRIENKGFLDLARSRGLPLGEINSSIPADGSAVEAQVFRSGKELTISENASLGGNDPLSSVLLSSFVTPVVFKEAFLGILVMGRTHAAPFFMAGKLKVARMVAEYLGIIVALGELQKQRAAEQLALRDLEIAAQIQLSLMPQEFHPVSGLDIYGTCRPALQSGGDYFDVITLPDQSILCVIADVMGKGLPAALLATMLRTNLHAVVASNVTSPAEVLTRINQLMCRDLIKLEMFITIVCAWVSADRSEVRTASAGHLSLLSQKADGGMVELEGQGMPVGIFPDATYRVESTPLAPGERLLLYTDGIVEATGDDDSLFEIERVKESLTASQKLTARETVDNLLREVSLFSGSRPPSDDRTMILVSRTQ
jgi:serine phosphatase RsbU (regulator of sigma subunit)/anti-sigma regulatory factor (Ser/Thr protein kinase)